LNEVQGAEDGLYKPDSAPFFIDNNGSGPTGTSFACYHELLCSYAVYAPVCKVSVNILTKGTAKLLNRKHRVILWKRYKENLVARR
jgi:hypothetical protein